MAKRKKYTTTDKQYRKYFEHLFDQGLDKERSYWEMTKDQNNRIIELILDLKLRIRGLEDEVANLKEMLNTKEES